MHVVDRIYGTQRISDPLVIALLKLKEFQRLKYIDLAGHFEPYIPGSFLSRYEHSLGVYFLLRMVGASREEQIAGLIHDISHSAFSHCIDYVLGNNTQSTQSHQDDIFSDYVQKSSIPAVLARYEVDLAYLLEEKHFPLKEKDVPDLCADRIDYSLRTAAMYGRLSYKEIRTILSDLCTHKGDWVFRGVSSASWYARVFERLNTLYYSGPFAALMFSSVGLLLGYALEKNYITVNDLYTTDIEVFRLLALHIQKDKTLRIYWQRAHNKKKIIWKNAKRGSLVVVKSRIVDPLYREGNAVRRLSDTNHVWKKTVATERIPKVYNVYYSTNTYIYRVT